MATFYILYSPSIDHCYIGSCLNLELRLEQHQHNAFENGFTRRANDWTVFFSVDNLEQHTASAIEHHVKKMKSRKYINDLKLFPEILEKLILKYRAGSSR